MIEPLMRIELTTSSLPRKCSTPELQRLLPSRHLRAEDEVRTRDLQLGRLSLYQLSYFRITSCKELLPSLILPARPHPGPESDHFVGEGGFEPPNSEEDRFTVCCRWPLGYSPGMFKAGRHGTPPCLSQRRDSNPRPADYKSAALPTELLWLMISNSASPPTIIYLPGPSPFLLNHRIFWEGKGKRIC